MASLDEIRKTITVLDSELLNLLAKRKHIAIEVAKSKKENPRPVRDQIREQELLVRLINQGNKLGLDSHYVTQIYHTILEDSVRSQQAYLQKLVNPAAQVPTVRIAFVGNSGSDSSLASQKYFTRYGNELVELGCTNYSDVVQQVESGQADYGVLPIENTSSGSINEVFDLLQHTSLFIVGEQNLKIEHSILAAPGTELSQIDTLYGHPQVFEQCSHYLNKQENITLTFCDSTANAMETAANFNSAKVAALGCPDTSKAFGLQALRKDITNQKENYSRFIIVARKAIDVALQVPAKTSIVIATGQTAGALVEALMVLRDKNIPMTKLESRPMLGNPWEESFYIDLAANLNSPALQDALAKLRSLTRYVKILGCYPSAEVAPTLVPVAEMAKAKSVSEKKPHLNGLSEKANATSASKINVRNIEIGGPNFVTIAGPRAVETPALALECAKQIKEFGGEVIFGGAFNQETSSAGSWGAKYQGLTDLVNAAEHYKLPTLAEVSQTNQVQKVAEQADLMFIRGEQMFQLELLQAVGKVNKPVVLSRHPKASIQQWLDAAHMIQQQGNQQVVLCESGIHTPDQGVTLDLTALTGLKTKTELPVLINLSYVLTQPEILAPLVQTAQTLGANGVIIETHPAPEHAQGSGPKQTSLSQFTSLMSQLFSR